jgi:hypothetical protein
VNRLLYSALIGTATLTAILLICVVGTRATSKPLSILATTPQGTPCGGWCLFGVEPETMSFVRSQYLLTKHPLVHGLDIIPAGSNEYFIGQDVDVAHGPGYASVQFHEPIRCESPSRSRPECFKRGNNRFLASLRNSLPLRVIIEELGIPDYFERGTDKYGAPLIRLYYRKLRTEFVYQLKDSRSVNRGEEIAAIWLFSKEMFDDVVQRSPRLAWPGFGMLTLSPSVSSAQQH